MKIKGFNVREQKCFNALSDGALHNIADLKKKFTSESVNDSQAQSMARNAIRRLIRDGWIEKKAYGSYQLTTTGKRWITTGKESTKSFGTKRGRKPMTDEDKAETARKKALEHKSAKKSPAKKKKISAAKKAEKKQSTSNGEHIKKLDIKRKIIDARSRAAKQSARDKAEEIKEKVSDMPQEEQFDATA